MEYFHSFRNQLQRKFLVSFYDLGMPVLKGLGERSFSLLFPNPLGLFMPLFTMCEKMSILNIIVKIISISLFFKKQFWSFFV